MKTKRWKIMNKNKTLEKYGDSKNQKLQVTMYSRSDFFVLFNC